MLILFHLDILRYAQRVLELHFRAPLVCHSSFPAFRPLNSNCVLQTLSKIISARWAGLIFEKHFSKNWKEWNILEAEFQAFLCFRTPSALQCILLFEFITSFSPRSVRPTMYPSLRKISLRLFIPSKTCPMRLVSFHCSLEVLFRSIPFVLFMIVTLFWTILYKFSISILRHALFRSSFLQSFLRKWTESEPLQPTSNVAASPFPRQQIRLLPSHFWKTTGPPAQ